MLNHTRTSALLFMLCVPAFASSLVETFSGTSIDPSLVPFANNNGSYSLPGGQMVFNTAAGGGATGLTTNFLLVGDFSVELHVNQSQTWNGAMSGWASGAGGFLTVGQSDSIGGWNFNTGGYDASLQDGSNTTGSPHVAWWYPTALRITRTGAEWTFQYQTGGPVWSTALDVTDANMEGAWALNLGLWSYGAQPAEMSIDYLSITADSFAPETGPIQVYLFHPNFATPEPASLGLLLAGGLLLPLLRRFRSR